MCAVVLTTTTCTVKCQLQILNEMKFIVYMLKYLKAMVVFNIVHCYAAAYSIFCIMKNKLFPNVLYVYGITITNNDAGR